MCHKKNKFNPLMSTTDLLTPFLIRSYHQMLTRLANHGKTFKIFHHKLAYVILFFYTPSLIGSINGRLFILTNRQVWG